MATRSLSFHSPRPSFAATFFAGAVLLWASLLTQAAPPDLTAGGTVPTTAANSGTINLGATGMRGWIYHVNENFTESRQILVTLVDAGSPAAGVLAVDDVILGADGSGASPLAFSSDARRSLAQAITDAEARDPGTLNLLRWRAGTITTVQITLRTMGAYSATAPYNCPKSAKILREGADYFLKSQTSGRYSFGTLALLAVKDPADPNNAAYQTRAQTEARALVPSAATMAQLMSNARDATSMITWQRGHTLIVLAEYYLATNDAVVLPAIEAYAVNISKNQSMFGTVGHIFAEKNPDGSDNGPMGGVYGVVNSAGLPCFYGLLLARECGVTHATLAPAIERSSRFFASYAGKGSIPYGEHEPGYQSHESNGKNGLCALAFALQSNRVNEGRFFAKMATASASERELGHTGAFFNYLWAPLGAAAGGEAAAAAHFSKVSWHYDLARRWNGAFVYDHTGTNGTSPSNGAEYNDFRMATVALLTYALPLRNLHITGRNQNPSPLLLTSGEVDASIAANTYNPSGRSNDELVTDLGNWSPKVRTQASDQLKTRTVSAALISQVTALANDPGGSSRVGACLALGKINDSGSAGARAATLAALLTDLDNHVRMIAAESLRQMGSARNAVVNTILAAAASTARPVVPFVEDDPLQFAHAKAAMLLFYSGSAYGPKGVLYNSITGVDRNLLYPAIKAVAATPTGLARSTLASTYKLLTLNDTLAVADAVVDSVQFRAPADKMFTNGVRQGGIEVLQKYGFAEGVPLSLIYMRNDVRDSVKPAAIGVLKAYAGSCTTVVPNPGVIEFLQSLGTAEALAALDAITAIPNLNPGPATPLKSIQSITADAATLTLPARSTVLRVNATDYARGPAVTSIYTWRKVQGTGAVSFTPNGTAASVATSIQIDAIPGSYLFEVTMSDSRGLTEVSATIGVTVVDPFPDSTPPEISTFSPADDSIAVALATNLVLTFNEPVTPGTGNITLRNLTNGTQSLISITDTTQISLSGSVLTINPAADLAGAKIYAIQIDATAIKDLSNNPFAGIANDTTWNFATAATPSNADITIVGSSVEAFLNSAKNGFATSHLGTTQISYNASGADKLVVAIGTESGSNVQKVNSVSISFNGIPMTAAVLDNTMTPAAGQAGAYDGGYAGIFYLDNPYQGPAAFTFSASTSNGAPNGAHVTIIGVAGTKPGVGNNGASWATQAAAGNVSTSLTTSANKSMAIAMVSNSGRNNSAGTPVLASGSLMTLAHNDQYGSSVWLGAASAHQSVPASGTTVTPTFNTAAGGNIHVVAVEFKASEITPNAYAVWSAQHPGADLTDPSVDNDKGGLPIGIEWVVGGNPTQAGDDAGLAPTIDTTTDPDGKFLFTFRRTAVASADANTTIRVEYGTSLGSWITALHQGIDANQITISEQTNGFGAGIDKVTVALPASLANGVQFFARLKVEVSRP